MFLPHTSTHTRQKRGGGSRGGGGREKKEVIMWGEEKPEETNGEMDVLISLIVMIISQRISKHQVITLNMYNFSPIIPQ